MTREVQHEAGAHRYTLWVDGRNVGLADYLERGDDIVFTHTEIDPTRRHEGLGEELIRGALDDARRRFGARIVPACPFVAEFVDSHPDYAELVAS